MRKKDHIRLRYTVSDILFSFAPFWQHLGWNWFKLHEDAILDLIWPLLTLYLFSCLKHTIISYPQSVLVWLGLRCPQSRHKTHMHQPELSCGHRLIIVIFLVTRDRRTSSSKAVLATWRIRVTPLSVFAYIWYICTVYRFCSIWNRKHTNSRKASAAIMILWTLQVLYRNSIGILIISLTTALALQQL